MDVDDPDEMNDVLRALAEALGDDLTTHDACYLLGRLCSLYLAFEEDEGFESWIRTVREARQYYIDHDVRSGGPPPSEH
jgi:hypothetical protein